MFSPMGLHIEEFLSIMGLPGPSGGLMKPTSRPGSPLLIFLLLLMFAVVPLGVRAQEHVVSPADLQKDLQAAAQTRQSNQAKVQKFLSTDQAKKALESAHLPYEKVQKAIPSLSDEELARLAAKTDKAQGDFAAGALTNQEITYIIIALATAVIIIIILKA
jgi:hypothetical protein